MAIIKNFILKAFVFFLVTGAIVSTSCAQEQEQVGANEVNLVLARLFRHVRRSKGQQRCVRDALPHPNTQALPAALDSAETQRLRQLVASRDVAAIAAEIRAVLGGELPT